MLGKFKRLSCLTVAFCLLLVHPTMAEASLPDKAEQELFFRATETITGVPWYVIAACYQYDKNLNKVKEGELPMTVHQKYWGGMGMLPEYGTISFFNQFYGGIGKDGDGDGVADQGNFYDSVYSIAQWLSSTGISEQEYIAAFAQLYSYETSQDRIAQIAAIYKFFGNIELSETAFPIPIHNNYSYRSTWGAGRSFGGARSHEGTDIFAAAWIPVQSTSYGIVEIKGWNRYGGWRLGIRDVNNVYHYYAHLSGYAKGLEEGALVRPGEIIGFVGNSGYGPEGTTGKFPPHLHYGMYKDTGKNEWAFDPTPSLSRWEKKDKQKQR